MNRPYRWRVIGFARAVALMVACAGFGACAGDGAGRKDDRGASAGAASASANAAPAGPGTAPGPKLSFPDRSAVAVGGGDVPAPGVPNGPIGPGGPSGPGGSGASTTSEGPSKPVEFLAGQPLRPRGVEAPADEPRAVAPVAVTPKTTDVPKELAAAKGRSATGVPGPVVVGGGLMTLFPGVRVDRAARVVEFDATVPIDAHDKDAPNVYLELVACMADTREHEALVVTRARASQVHAGLLLIGLEAGSPGRLDFGRAGAEANEPVRPVGAAPEGVPGGVKPTVVTPRGPVVEVELAWKDEGGRSRVSRPQEWIKSARDGARFPRSVVWVFGGSRFISRAGADGKAREFYEADGAGTLIGLATFGSETIGPAMVFSPDAGVDEPVWIADGAAVPVVGTAVVVRVRATGDWFGERGAAGGEREVEEPKARVFENVPR